MQYRTEMTDRILLSDEAKKMIQYLSPIYGESYIMLWLLQVIGLQLDNVKDWTEELENQVMPQTATWSLSQWETEYNIVPELNWTVEQRRTNIVNKMKLRNPMNPYFFEQIISGLAGVPVEIEENTGRNHFTVHVRAHTTLDKFHRAIEGINQYKPSHLIYTIDIAELRDATIAHYVAVPVTTFKQINVEVQNI